jgi:hypothetical protein
MPKPPKSDPGADEAAREVTPHLARTSRMSEALAQARVLAARAEDLHRKTERLAALLEQFGKTDSDLVIGELRAGLNEVTLARRDFDVVFHDVQELTDHALDACDVKTRHILGQ